MKQHRFLTILTATLLLGSVVGGNGYAAPSSVKAEAVTLGENSKISLNKGDAKSLMQIKGMSAYKAHAIVAYRNKNGAFKTVSELEKVKGFKRMTPESMKVITDHLLID